jgi:hypothetical protein
MLKLYEISGQYAALMNLIADKDGEISEAEQMVLQDLQGEFDTKVENIAKLVKNMEGEHEAYKNESKRLADRARTVEKRVDWFKDYIKNEMLRMNRSAVKGDILTVAVRPSMPACIITDEKAIPLAYMRVIPETREPDKKAIIAKWKESGKDMAGTRISVGLTLTIR